MDSVPMVLPLAHQVYQVFLGAQDPRDPRASQDHPVLEVPRDHKGTKATRESLETKASQVNRDIQEKWDLKGPRADRVHEEPKVTQEIKEAREPQALRDLRDLRISRSSGEKLETVCFQNFERRKGHWLDKGISVFLLINCNFTKLYLTLLLQ